MSDQLITYENTPPPTPDEGAKHLEQARNRAAVALDHVLFALHLKALEPGNSIKQLVDMGEHFYKISGLGAKQAAQAATPLRVSFNFNQKPAERTIEGEVVLEVQPEAETLPEPPAGISLMLFQIDDALDCSTDE